MKNKWNQWKETLQDLKTMTKKEYLLTMAVCILGGIVAGILLAPKKNLTIGSNNGNHCGNGCDCAGGDASCCEEASADQAEVE